MATGTNCFGVNPGLPIDLLPTLGKLFNFSGTVSSFIKGIMTSTVFHRLCED